jgi:hypothetical protein
MKLNILTAAIVLIPLCLATPLSAILSDARNQRNTTRMGNAVVARSTTTCSRGRSQAGESPAEAEGSR